MYLKGWSILRNIDISLHRVDWLSLTIHLPEHPCLQPYFRSSRQAFHALGARSREVSKCYPSHTYKPHPSGEGTIWTDGRLVYQIVLWYIDLKTCCSKDSYNAHCASPLSGMVDSFKLFSLYLSQTTSTRLRPVEGVWQKMEKRCYQHTFKTLKPLWLVRHEPQ